MPPPSPAIGNLRRRDHVHHLLRCTRTVERAVAQRDAAEVGHRALEVLDGGKRLALPLGRVRVESVGLGLDGAAGARVRPAGVALRDEALHAGGARCREQMVETRGAQDVRRREDLVEATQVAHAGQRGHLMDDRVRRGAGDRLTDGCSVQSVDDERLGPEVPEQVDLRLAPGRGGYVVAGCDQLRDQAAADGAGGSGDEYTHCTVSFVRFVLGGRTGDEMPATDVTAGPHGFTRAS